MKRGEMRGIRFDEMKNVHADVAGSGNKMQRLNKILSAAGLASRRQADQWISAGRVAVNGRVIQKLGSTAIWGKDSIRVDGKKIPEPPGKIYLMLNKPFGYICSLRDPEGRPLVMDLLQDIPQRIYPVGRLDFDSLGLLLFTNDGEWAYRLTHPKYQIPRTYKVTMEGTITDQAMNRLRDGVPLHDGPSGSSSVTLLSKNERQTLIRMTITQGRSRQVRRMLEAVGYRVVHLVRISYGNLQLGNLKSGQYRYLLDNEIGAMKKLAKIA